LVNFFPSSGVNGRRTPRYCVRPMHEPSRVEGSTAKEPLTREGRLTVAGFQGLIRDRYYATDAARGAPGTFLWFMEEVGELATALQNNLPGKTPSPEQRANLEEECADVLAWLPTLANICGVDLDAALAKDTAKGGAGTVEGVKD